MIIINKNLHSEEKLCPFSQECTSRNGRTKSKKKEAIDIIKINDIKNQCKIVKECVFLKETGEQLSKRKVNNKKKGEKK